MQISRTYRNRLLSAAVLGMLLASSSLPAHAASKEIIELHGGAVQIESQFGVGTTVTLWLSAASE